MPSYAWPFILGFSVLIETIYVRVYEERMDLLRAVMVGPSGTPYHDGLFFFDICFPPNYPHSPPVRITILVFHNIFVSFTNVHHESLIFHIFLCSKHITILVGFESIQTCIQMGRFVWVFSTPGLVLGVRTGTQKSLQCCKSWSPFKLSYWTQNLTSTSRVMNNMLTPGMVKSGPSTTMRRPSCILARPCCTRWEDHQRHAPSCTNCCFLSFFKYNSQSLS